MSDDETHSLIPADTKEHYPVLTNVLTEGTFGLVVRSYLSYKSLSPRANLQDNMTPSELALSVLSKATAQQLHENRDSLARASLNFTAM